MKSARTFFKVKRNLKFLAGLVIGISVTGTTAYSVSVNNTPEGGYLLCVNPSSKVVTFPGKLSCPKGSRPLELGAQGLPGEDGSDGLDGMDASPTTTPTLFGTKVPSRDIAGTPGVSKFSELKKVIMATITPSSLSGGAHYELAVDLNGVWASQSGSGSYINCYFQDAADYPAGSVAYGGASATFNSWTGIYLHVTAHPSDYSLSKSNLYLVCATNGVVSGLDGYMYAHSVPKYSPMNLGNATVN